MIGSISKKEIFFFLNMFSCCFSSFFFSVTLRSSLLFLSRSVFLSCSLSLSAFFDFTLSFSNSPSDGCVDLSPLLLERERNSSGRTKEDFEKPTQRKSEPHEGDKKANACAPIISKDAHRVLYIHSERRPFFSFLFVCVYLFICIGIFPNLKAKIDEDRSIYLSIQNSYRFAIQRV